MTDGRNLRLQRNRTNMLEAGVFFAQEGNWRPTVRQIANRANVSVRSFFQHFKNLEAYNAVLLENYQMSLRAAFACDSDPDGALRIAVRGRA